jgi:hypothetical protein
MDKEDSLGVAGQDCGQGMLNDGVIVPCAAPSDQETEGLAHRYLS